jgi:uncharacterized protein YjiS (DUF1127 family)
MTTNRTWKKVRDSLFAWQERSYRNTELRNLSDRTLRDIGLVRGNEISPPRCGHGLM